MSKQSFFDRFATNGAVLAAGAVIVPTAAIALGSLAAIAPHAAAAFPIGRLPEALQAISEVMISDVARMAPAYIGPGLWGAAIGAPMLAAVEKWTGKRLFNLSIKESLSKGQGAEPQPILQTSDREVYREAQQVADVLRPHLARAPSLSSDQFDFRPGYDELQQR